MFNILEDYENKILVFSSLFYITNVFTAFLHSYYLYGSFFLLLTFTSVLFHSYSNMYTNVLDKIFVFLIVCYGGNMLYNKLSYDKTLLIFFIVCAFIACVFLFFYGYCTNKYCYDIDKTIGDKYHAFLHFISSFGHHLIIFL
jgi:hypothetical protein